MKNATTPSHDEDICDEVYWRSICSALTECCTLEEFGNLVEELEDSGLRPFSELNIPKFNSEMHAVDDITRLDGHIYPPNMEPIYTEGDRNYFCRALSKACYGTEKHHRQLRAGLATEGYKNMDKYLDNTYLMRGERIIHKKGTMAGLFAYYSGSCEHEHRFENYQGNLHYGDFATTKFGNVHRHLAVPAGGYVVTFIITFHFLLRIFRLKN